MKNGKEAWANEGRKDVEMNLVQRGAKAMRRGQRGMAEFASATTRQQLGYRTSARAL